MEKLRVVQIGTSNHVHAAHLMNAMRNMNELYEVLGIVEEDEKLKEMHINKAPFDGVPFITMEQALDLKLDAFMVETDELKLVEYATKMLQKGYHVYMDKPGSADKESFRKMCMLAKEKNLVLSLGYMYRYNPALVYAKELADSGKLGKILNVEAHMSCLGNAGYRKSLENLPCGMMYYLGCHLTDIVVRFCGFPKEILPLNTKTSLLDVSVYDSAFCVYKYDDGISFVKTSCNEYNGFERRQVVITGSEGTVEIRPIETPLGNGYDVAKAYVTLKEDNANNTDFDKSRYLEFEPHLRYNGLLENFACFVRGEKENPYSYDFEADLHDVIMDSCRE